MNNLVTAGQSTINRRYQYDITACWHCQIFSAYFLEKLRDKILQEISDRTASFNLRHLLDKSICVLYFVCHHNVEYIQNHLHTIDSSCSHRLVLCTSNPDIVVGQGRKMSLIPDSTNYENRRSFEEVLLRKIHDILGSCILYDDASLSETERVYSTEIAGLAAISTRIDRSTAPNTSQHDTNDYIYDTLPPVVDPKPDTTASGRFIGALSLKPDRREPQILDIICLPSDSCGKESINYIKNVELPKLLRDNSITEIAQHLSLVHHAVTNQVIHSLIVSCFQLPMTIHLAGDIPKVLRLIWNFLDKLKGDITMVKSFTMISNLLIGLSLLLSLRIEYGDSLTKDLLSKEILPEILSWLKIEALDDKVKEFLLGSQMFMNDLVKGAKKRHSFIQMGDWKATLRSESNRKTLLNGTKKMTLIEKMATVLQLVRLKCDPAVHIPELTAMIATIACDCFSQLRKFEPKQQKSAVVQSFCYLVTRSLVHVISRLKETEDATPFVGALKHMLQDKTWTKEQKDLFYPEITSILVHPDLQTRVELLSILASFQNVDMGRVTRSYVEDKLRNGQLYISEEVQCFGSKEDKLHKPHWSDCKGIFGEVEIRIKLLVPTKNCISKSIDAKYKARQIAGHERFDNSLNIISHVHQNNGFHENIASLLAFQTNQMPLFYAIQADGTINFLQYLLRRRDRKEWLSFSTLCAYIKDAIAAITYLHSNNIVHRDITACRFELQEEQSRLKLTDFRLAKKLDTHTDELCLDDSETLATRWTAVESLKADVFSTKSDVWMISLFMYEVYTHGCWPYSELVDKETDNIMHMVIIRDYNQSQPRCIPQQIFKVMLLCLERRVDKRISLEDLEQKLAAVTLDLLSSTDQTATLCTKYIKLTKQQRILNGMPELGVPALVKQLKDRSAIPYYNIKGLPVTTLPLQHEDLIDDECEPDINKGPRGKSVIVTERLNNFSLVNNLPSYLQLREITGLPDKALNKVVDTGDTYLEYTYADKGGERLIDAAFKTPEAKDLVRYLYMLSKLVKEFHEKKWIVRCFTARDIWKTGSKKVNLLRLGRACKVTDDATGDGHVIDEPFKDRLNWLPLEVHRDKCYTRKSDVYMFGMVCYEIFTALRFNRENPIRNPIFCVPFYMTQASQLQDVLQDGDIPDKPVYCPVSLYKLMKECWSRDVVKRPSMSDIVDRLKDIYHKQDFNHDEDESSELSTIPDDSSFTDTDTTSDSDIEDIPPPIPKRQERKDNGNVDSDIEDIPPPIPKIPERKDKGNVDSDIEDIPPPIHKRPERKDKGNDPLLHNENLPSGSDDSFPKEPPKRLPHLVRQSSSSSYPESTGTDSETDIPRSKGMRLHNKKHRIGKSKCPKAPPFNSLVWRNIAGLNDNYITPVHSSVETEDSSISVCSSLISSDEAQDMNERTSMGYYRSSSIMSNSSTDTFPSCPPSPLKVTKNLMPH